MALRKKSSHRKSNTSKDISSTTTQLPRVLLNCSRLSATAAADHLPTAPTVAEPIVGTAAQKLAKESMVWRFPWFPVNKNSPPMSNATSNFVSKPSTAESNACDAAESSSPVREWLTAAAISVLPFLCALSAFATCDCGNASLCKSYKFFIA